MDEFDKAFKKIKWLIMVLVFLSIVAQFAGVVMLVFHPEFVGGWFGEVIRSFLTALQ